MKPSARHPIELPEGTGGRILAWQELSIDDAARRLESEGWTVLATDIDPTRDPIEHVEALLVRAAAGLYPAWLPEAIGIDNSTGAGLDAVRRLATRAATSSSLFGPFLEMIAVGALRDGRDALALGFSAATVIGQCAQLIVRSHPDSKGLVLVLSLAGSNPPGHERELELIWLAELDACAVRLVGPASALLERIPRRLCGPPSPVPNGSNSDYMTPLDGRPSPISEIETRLESYLSACSWAYGRRWNHTIAPGPLDSSMRVDLVWCDERCVVEIDGPEHWAAAKYLADRRRDRILQRLGYRVLRFTNDEVVGDIARTANEIASFLAGVRERQTYD